MNRSKKKWRIVATTLAGALAALAYSGSLGPQAADVVQVLVEALAAPAAM